MAGTTKKSARKPVKAPARSNSARGAKSRRSASVIFDTITLEGALFSSAMLARIASRGAGHQSEADYGIPKGLTLRDEIARYFRIGTALFDDFAASPTPSATATVDLISGLLSQVFGFTDVQPGSQTALEAKQGRVPVVIVPPEDDLDRASLTLSGEGRRRSAASTLQDWLNQNDHTLWGFCANGDRLRLMRDNASLTRPAFVEVNLRQIFEGENFADFAAMWQIFHATRFGAPGTPPNECILETWREDGAKEGVAARDRLRDGVEAALLALGNGFLANPDNASLGARITSGDLPLPKFFGQLLRLVYRMIFLLVAEDRGLLHPPGSSPSAARLYAEGYSLRSLRDRAIRRTAWDLHFDRWEGLLISFAGLAWGQPKLALPALGGLFDDTAIPDLESARLSNRALMEAVFRLAWLKDDSTLVPVNWRDMETEELGSVYESLLELTPILIDHGRGFAFATGQETKGNQRKTTGSYYTPDSLVQTLLDSALDPVLDRVESESNDKVEGLLGVTVIDPACGSGHFLLAAARRIAVRVARARTGGVASTHDYRHALRDVVRSCIHGVDRNPMAVELTKVALWIETVEPVKPLGFLDANILCGDSLLGVFDLEVLRQGIPDAAYKTLSGDDKDACKHFVRRNKSERDIGQGTFDFAEGKSSLPAAPPLATSLRVVRSLPEDTPGEIAEKKKRLAAAKSERQLRSWRVAADLYIAAFLLGKKESPRLSGEALIPTTDHVWRTLKGGQVYGPLMGTAWEVVDKARVFHWPLEFPDVLAKGGFDAVIGNPPWERVKLQEQEFFAAREPEIATAPNASGRARLIAALRDSAPGTRQRRLFDEFEATKRVAEASAIYARESGRFPLTGRGDVNTYALFAELVAALTNVSGRSGLILPTGIATDATTATYFSSIVREGRLARLISFENEEFIFPSVHHSYRFCILSLGPKGIVDPKFCFFLRRTHQLHEAERSFTLSPSQIAHINPVTRNAPIFRSQRDAALVARIYQNAITIQNHDERGPLAGLRVQRFLDMNRKEIMSLVVQQPTEGWVPVFEGKLFWQYDHRHATYSGEQLPELVPGKSKTTTFEARPRYWIERKEIEDRLTRVGWNFPWMIGLRDVTGAILERTVIASALPFAGTDYTVRTLIAPNARSAILLLALANTVVFDYVARTKLGGNHLAEFVFQQLPVPLLHAYGDQDVQFLVSRTVELVYTSESMGQLAKDVGYNGPPFQWNEDRRAMLRAELDAWHARAYGLTRDDLRYILDPADVVGEDYPSETFRVLKNNEMKKFGEYRTRRLVLEAWDRMGLSEVASAATATPRHRYHAPMDPSNLADGAWAASSDSAEAALAQLAALIKALPGPTPIARIRLAALFALEPRYLTRRLSGTERDTWLRLVGTAAHLPQGTSIALFAPRINANWQSAVTQLRGMGAIFEDASARTWAPGSRIHEFVTETWPDGRAAFVLRALESLSLDDATSGLPAEDRAWVEAYAA